MKDFFSTANFNDLLLTWLIGVSIAILVLFCLTFVFNSFYLPVESGVFYLTDIQHIESKRTLLPNVNGSGQASTKFVNTEKHILLIGELRRFDDPPGMMYPCTFKISPNFEHPYQKMGVYRCLYVKYHFSNELKVIDIQGEYK